MMVVISKLFKIIPEVTYSLQCIHLLQTFLCVSTMDSVLSAGDLGGIRNIRAYKGGDIAMAENTSNENLNEMNI